VCGNLPGANRPNSLSSAPITPELPDPIQDPRADPVLAKQVAGGKAGLITLQSEEPE